MERRVGDLWVRMGAGREGQIRELEKEVES